MQEAVLCFCKQFTCTPTASLTLWEMKNIFLKDFIPLKEIQGKSVVWDLYVGKKDNPLK